MKIIIIFINKGGRKHDIAKKKSETTGDKDGKYIIYLNEETIMKYGSKEENKEKLEN